MKSIFIVPFALAIALPSLCSAAQYSVTDLGRLLPNGGFAQPHAINASGQVAGGVFNAGGSRVAFLYSGGPIQSLGSLGGSDAAGEGINASGQVVGYSNLSNGDLHAFMYDGTMHDIGGFGGRNTQANGINDGGQIVGYSETAGNPSSAQSLAFMYDGTMHDLWLGNHSVANAINNNGQIVGSVGPTPSNQAFLISGGTTTLLGTLPGLGGGSSATAINPAGDVVGFSGPGNGAVPAHAFLYSGGNMTDLGTLGGTGGSWAYGINASGLVVGADDPGNGIQHAFLYNGGPLVDLNTLIAPGSGWLLQAGYGINTSGQITGEGLVGGVPHGFLLTPTPEPSSIVLAVMGLGGLAAWGWRRSGRQRLGCSRRFAWASRRSIRSPSWSIESAPSALLYCGTPFD